MGGSWDHVLGVFQKTGPEASPPALRKEPASTIEPGKPTSTPQEGAKKRTTRKAPKGSPKAP